MSINSLLQAQSKEGSGNKGGGGGGGTGPAVSTLAGGETSDSDIPDEEKTVFDWCKECRVAKLEEMVTKESIDSKDGQVRWTRSTVYIALFYLNFM